MIVLDASTLILLAKAELLGAFLQAAKRKALIPREVEKECCEMKQSLDALVISRAIQEKRIKVAAVANKRLCDQLLRDFPLARGETEAIVLAASRKAVLATDDKQAINACKLLGVPFTTAIGILVRMREKGVLGKDEAIQKLETLARFGRYKVEIVKDARARLEGIK